MYKEVDLFFTPTVKSIEAIRYKPHRETFCFHRRNNLIFLNYYLNSKAI